MAEVIEGGNLSLEVGNPQLQHFNIEKLEMGLGMRPLRQSTLWLRLKSKPGHLLIKKDEIEHKGGMCLLNSLLQVIARCAQFGIEITCLLIAVFLLKLVHGTSENRHLQK